MNSKFVIESKYDNEVGFIELDNTRKLVRHFESIISEKIHITIDIYQDGLIKIYKKDRVKVEGRWYIRNNLENIIELLLSLELTNGENINEHYLDLLESIYSPFCKYPIMKELSEFAEPDKVELFIDLITNTFKTLHIMKKMYENSFIC
jgi:hypothetical protein